MPAVVDQALWTFDDFCERIPEGLKADLIEGVIYVASPDNIEHYGINSWLHTVLNLIILRRKLKGRLFGFKIAFRLNVRNGPEPDLAYVSPLNLHRIHKTYIDGPPNAAFEIVSPDSIERDYRKKRKQYQRAGVEEYWIIDPLLRRVRCLRLGKDKKYHAVRPRNGRMESEVIPGFWLKASWLWQAKLPDEIESVNEILAFRELNGSAK
jgi:Uma2 family endonuclease